MSENNPQDPRRLWRTKTDPSTGEVTITNPEDDPWDTDSLLYLPDGASPVNPGPDLLEIYVAMVIGARSKDRDFSDEVALDRCTGGRAHRHNLRTGLARGSRPG